MIHIYKDLGDEWLSLLLPTNSLVSGPGVFGFCIGHAKWGGLLLDVVEAGRSVGGNVLYRIGKTVSWIHVTDPDPDWLVYDYVPCSPLELHSEQPGVHGNRIVIRRKFDDGISLLKGRLSTAASIKSMSFADLVFVADYYDNKERMSRTGLLTYLAKQCCTGLPENDVESFVNMVLSYDRKAETPKVDAMTESVFKEMDPDDQKEHASVGKKIEEINLKRKCTQWEAEYNPTKKKRKLGNVPKHKKGKGKGKGAPAAASRDLHSAGQGIQIDGGALGAAIVRGPRGPKVFDWGSLGDTLPNLFHFALLQRAGGRPAGYKVTCRYHQAEVSLRGRGATPIPCGREHRADDDSPEALTRCLHGLMEWALLCEQASSGNDHVFGDAFKSLEFAATTQESLDNRCSDLCGRVCSGLPSHLDH